MAKPRRNWLHSGRTVSFCWIVVHCASVVTIAWGRKREGWITSTSLEWEAGRLYGDRDGGFVVYVQGKMKLVRIIGDGNKVDGTSSDGLVYNIRYSYYLSYVSSDFYNTFS